MLLKDIVAVEDNSEQDYNITLKKECNLNNDL